MHADALVGTHAETPGTQVAQIRHRGNCLIAQGNQAGGIAVERFANLGQAVFISLRAAEQRRIHLLFELAHGDADTRWLAEDALRGTTNAALLDHRHKHLELHHFHDSSPRPCSESLYVPSAPSRSLLC